MAIVTGGNRGIGVHVVNKLLNHGLSVIVAVRTPDPAMEELSRVVDVCKYADKIHIECLDISDMTSVRAFGQRIKQKFDKIDILIHNGKMRRWRWRTTFNNDKTNHGSRASISIGPTAGIMACPYKKTVDGFESQVATNYLGPFLLTHQLMPLLKSAGTEDAQARVILVSSVLHFGGHIPFKDFHSR